ncbi:MAG: TraQ conjugal transfer family protein [Paludibacter sp.]
MKKTIILSMVAAMLLLFTECDDKLDVQQVYEFSVSTLPLQKKIKVCETVEIRFKLIRSDKYEGAKYYFNFFQPEGKGYIQNENKDILIPNDTYELTSETFSLYYTSFCLDKQSIDITIRDNFNQEHKLTFNFENDKGNAFPLLIKDENLVNLE